MKRVAARATTNLVKIEQYHRLPWIREMVTGLDDAVCVAVRRLTD